MTKYDCENCGRERRIGDPRQTFGFDFLCRRCQLRFQRDPNVCGNRYSEKRFFEVQRGRED